MLKKKTQILIIKLHFCSFLSFPWSTSAVSIQGKQECAESSTLLNHAYVLMSSPKKQRLRSSPAHSWTPTMPKMKKTKKQRRRTFPSMGRVSNRRVTRIRIPSRGKEKTVSTKKMKHVIRADVSSSRLLQLNQTSG